MSQAVLLVDHGSRRAEANDELVRIADQVAVRAPDWVVRVAHLEITHPDIGEGIDACVEAGARRVVVHPYFLGPGRHTTHDIPRQVDAAAERHPGIEVRISAPLGPDPRFVDVILDRVERARA